VQIDFCAPFFFWPCLKNYELRIEKLSLRWRLSDSVAGSHLFSLTCFRNLRRKAKVSCTTQSCFGSSKVVIETLWRNIIAKLTLAKPPKAPSLY